MPAGRWAVLSTREQATQTATHETVPTVPQSHTEEARPQAVASPASDSPASDPPASNLPASDPPASDQRSTGKRSAGKRSAICRQAIRRQAICRQAIHRQAISDPPASLTVKVKSSQQKHRLRHEGRTRLRFGVKVSGPARFLFALPRRSQ